MIYTIVIAKTILFIVTTTGRVRISNRENILPQPVSISHSIIVISM